jgi:tetratricopeptide (TPR) repeat protein
VVDVSLLAFLSKARAAHHQADIAERAGKVAEAIQPLERLVVEAVPGTTKPAPEVREVLADTYARLAELHSSLGEFVAAHEALERGLRLATERTHFRGRLMEVRGLVEERHAKKLAADGDSDGARTANARAVAAFEQAIEIQADVIEQTLADAGDAPGPALGHGGAPAAGHNP